MDELVERLTSGLQPIIAARSASARELREQIERRFVLLKFPCTRGGTELGSQMDMQLTRLDGANFENGTGIVHLVGNLTLNYTKLQLVADINLKSLEGTGQLVLVKEAGSSQHSQTNSPAANVSGLAVTAKMKPKHNRKTDGMRVAKVHKDGSSGERITRS